MSALTLADVEAFAARYGLRWLTPELAEQLHANMVKAATEGLAVPRQPSEFNEPALIFAGPGANP